MTSGTKAAIYGRVSTLLGQDPEHQLHPCREVANNRNLKIHEEYVDLGISGSKEKRPALDRLLLAAKQGEFQVLIIYSVDRLGRNTKHLLNLIDELKQLGISLVSLREGLDFATPVGQMTLTVLAGVAQLERELISERIRTALAVKKKLAESSGSAWKCGRPATNKYIEEKVIELRRSGKSIRQISRELENISKSTVSRILKTRVS